MTVASFEGLCTGFCEVAGLGLPNLQPDVNGTLAMTVDIGEVPATVMHFNDRPDKAFVIVEFGEVPQDQGLAGWSALMHANMILLGGDPHAFSRNPHTGAVVLHCAYPLARVTPAMLHERLEGLARLAGQWRNGNFMTELGALAACNNQSPVMNDDMHA